MPITPHLSRQLRQALGEEAADDLVNWMHEMDAQRGASRDAVRADLAELRQEMHAGLSKLREEMLAGFARTDARLADAAEQRARLEARFERRFGDLIRWSFVFWVSAVSAIALLAEVLP